MNLSLNNVEQFINYFNLRRLNGIVSFFANINFITDGHTQTAGSEVQIITSDNIVAIYFLSLANEALPDMFSAKNASFRFIDKQYLKIESDKYAVTIFPV